MDLNAQAKGIAACWTRILYRLTHGERWSTNELHALYRRITLAAVN